MTLMIVLMTYTASLSEQLDTLRHDNSHLSVLTNQLSTSDDRDALNRKIAYLHKHNGTVSRVTCIVYIGKLISTCSTSVAGPCVKDSRQRSFRDAPALQLLYLFTQRTLTPLTLQFGLVLY